MTKTCDNGMIFCFKKRNGGIKECAIVIVANTEKA